MNKLFAVLVALWAFLAFLLVLGLLYLGLVYVIVKIIKIAWG